MPPPSQLAVATASLIRLIKEEASYHKELEDQRAHYKKLEGNRDDENTEFLLKQQSRAIDETNAILPQLKDKIVAAKATVESKLGGEDPAEDVEKAKKAVQEASNALREISDRQA